VGLESEIAAARARLDEIKAARLGSIHYTQVLGLVNRAHGNPVQSSQSKNDFLDGVGPFTRLDISADVPLLTFGRVGAAIEAAEQDVESRVAHEQVRRGDAVLDVKRLYYQVLLTRQLAGVLEEAVDQMSRAVTKTEERLAAGQRGVQDADLLRLKIGRAKLEKGFYEVQSSASLSKIALAHAIGEANDAAFDLADRKLTPATTQLQGVDVYIREALANRPETRALVHGIAAESARVDVEQSQYFPTIGLALGVQFARTPNHDEQTNWFAWDEFNYFRPILTAVLRWNLNFFLTHARVNEAQAMLSALEWKHQSALSGIELDVKRAYGEIERMKGTVRATEEGSKAGRALMVSEVSNFDLGFGKAEDLFNALMSYAESHADYLRAIDGYNSALGALSRSVGRELEGLSY
jgi:outer membrane protein TolC